MILFSISALESSTYTVAGFSNELFALMTSVAKKKQTSIEGKQEMFEK